MQLSNWINPKILQNKKSFKKQFLEAPFFEHISIENFLNNQKAQQLLVALNSLKYYKEENDLYNFFRTGDFKDLIKYQINDKNKILCDFRNFLLTKDFIEFIEYITNSKINKKIIDIHSLKLENTNYLLCHDDQVLGRQLAFIFNLSKNWTAGDGGQLEFFESNKIGHVSSKVFKSITPTFNQFNMFKVQKISFHQISEITSNKQRLSIGGWYHV